MKKIILAITCHGQQDLGKPEEGQQDQDRDGAAGHQHHGQRLHKAVDHLAHFVRDPGDPVCHGGDQPGKEAFFSLARRL